MLLTNDDFNEPLVGKKIKSGFMERGSIISTISRKTCDSAITTSSIFSKGTKLSSEDIELLEISRKRDEKKQAKDKVKQYFEKLQVKIK